MKKNLKALCFIILTGSIIVSCKRAFLDTKPLGEVDSDVTWSDAPLSEAFVNGIYNGLGVGGFSEEMLASLSDEAMFTHAGRGINTVNEGTLNPSNIGFVHATYRYEEMYRRIRPANVAIERLKTATFSDTALKNRLNGEAHFLRAYFYHQLVRYYGGVPLVLRAYGLNEDYAVERNTFEQCVNQIVKDCDTAIWLLGNKSMAKGRATKLAAMALQSRILLYAASDLHDMPTAKAKSSTINGFAKPEIIGYVSGSRSDRWLKAKTAAKAVMDASAGYRLDLSSPVTAEEGKTNYISIAMAGHSKAPGLDASAEKEIIFGRYYVPNLDEGRPQTMGLNNGPNGYHNWAGNTPIQTMVDDYEMMDGTRFDWNNPVQSAAPYDGRDPRFYASILYDGAGWKPRELISGNVDPANQIQVGKYQVGTGFIAGLDTRQSSIENWNGSWTGYYHRKFIDPDPKLVDNNSRQFIPWPFFRYTEAVFNYIEASLETGDETEGRNWLNKIRFRAGMPAIPVTVSGDSLKQRYRNEKRIEMVLEEQRFHDARRWMIAPATLGRKTIFMQVTGTLKPGATAPVPYRMDRTKYNYSYVPVVDNSLENRTWVDKMYFLPIFKDEMNKNPKLIQNPGY